MQLLATLGIRINPRWLLIVKNMMRTWSMTLQVIELMRACVVCVHMYVCALGVCVCAWCVLCVCVCGLCVTKPLIARMYHALLLYYL